MTLYSERDIQTLDRQGNYYSRHVSAMTSEGLHDKNDIAAELAWRDARIDALAAHLERIQSVERDETEYGRNVMDILDYAPASSLARLKAQWQAEVLESCENMAETSFIPCLGREEQVVLMDDILKVAAELRRQAEGGA